MVRGRACEAWAGGQAGRRVTLALWWRGDQAAAERSSAEPARELPAGRTMQATGRRWSGQSCLGWVLAEPGHSLSGEEVVGAAKRLGEASAYYWVFPSGVLGLRAGGRR